MSALLDEVAWAIANPDGTCQVSRIPVLADALGLGGPVAAPDRAPDAREASDWLGRAGIHVHAYTATDFDGFMAYRGDNPDQATQAGYGASAYLAVLDLIEAAYQTANTDPMIEMGLNDLNLVYVAHRLVTIEPTVPERKPGTTWFLHSWLGYLMALPGSLHITRDGNQWCALVGPDLQLGVAAFHRTREDAVLALMDELSRAVIYANGQLARPGDLIFCHPREAPHPVSAVVVDVCPTADPRGGHDLFVASAWPMALHPDGVAIAKGLEPIPVSEEGLLRPFAMQCATPGLALVRTHGWLVGAPVAPADAPFWVSLQSGWANARAATPCGAHKAGGTGLLWPPYPMPRHDATADPGQQEGVPHA